VSRQRSSKRFMQTYNRHLHIARTAAAGGRRPGAARPPPPLPEPLVCHSPPTLCPKSSRRLLADRER